MFSAISSITTLTRCGRAGMLLSGVLVWYFLDPAVPCLSGRLGARPTPTHDRHLAGGPPPQIPRDPGQTLICRISGTSKITKLRVSEQDGG
jgi:hypothetical protein